MAGVIDSARYSYEMSCPQYGWAEQNPEDWYQAFRQGLAEIFDKHPEIAKQISAIGVTGQMIRSHLVRQICASHSSSDYLDGSTLFTPGRVFKGTF